MKGGQITTTIEGSLGWSASFKLSWDILENIIRDADGIISEIRTNELGNKFLTGFSLRIPPSNAEEALIIAVEKGNRVADYLGSIHSLPVQAYLLNITEIKLKGEAKAGIANILTSANVHQPVDLDFSNIKNLIACEDTKILRQLAHYNFGLRYSYDPINQFREFYLVLEDEYGKRSPELKKYSYIRHALNHPELNNKEFKIRLLGEIGAYHIDPSSPEAQKLVEDNLQSLKQDANRIILKILDVIKV